MDIPKIPVGLIEQIAKGKCVVFVGAGLSMGAGLPSWSALLRKMMTWAENSGVKLEARAELDGYIDEGKLLMVAEEMLERLGKDRFRQFMEEVFQNPELQPTDAHKLITQIPFSAALTTNYDKLLESAYELDVVPPVFTHTQHAELSGALRSDKFHLVKLHGTIDDIETIILARSGYRNLMNDRPAYHTYLTTILSTKTILFLGFSLTDPDPMEHLDELMEIFKGYTGTHYALMSDIKPIEQSHFHKGYNIQIIPYISSTPDHPEVTAFLSELAARAAESENIEVKTKKSSELELDDSYNISPFTVIGISIIVNFIYSLINGHSIADDISTRLKEILLGNAEFAASLRERQWKNLYVTANLEQKIQAYQSTLDKIRCILEIVKAFREAINSDDPLGFQIEQKYQRDLDDEMVSNELAEKLQISSDANITVEREGKEWLVTDRMEKIKNKDNKQRTDSIKYSIRKSEDNLEVRPVPTLSDLVENVLSLFRDDEHFYHEATKSFQLVVVSKLFQNASSHNELINKEKEFLGSYSNYAEKLKHQCQQLDLLGVRGSSDIELELEDIFVTLSLFERAPQGGVPRIYSENSYSDEYRTQKPIKANELFDNLPKNAVLILGRPGAGKTTMAKYQSLRYLESFSEPAEGRIYLPVFIQLRDFVKYSGHIVKRISIYLEEELGESFDSDILELYLEQGHIAVLYDGLDEIADIAQLNQMASAMAAFAAEYPAGIHIITCRTATYPKINVSMSGFAKYTLDDMNREQRSEFIHNWYNVRTSQWTGENVAEIADQLVEEIENSPALLRLAVNPLMLTIMTIIYGDLKHIPNTRLELYEECISVLMHKRDKARGYPGLEEIRRKKPQPDFILAELAYGLHTESVTQDYSVAELPKETIQNRISEIIIDSRKATEDSECNAIRTMEVPDFCTFIEQRTAILVDRPMGRYGFVHQTFQEYFAAYYINTIRDFDKLWTKIRDKIWQPYWREVILLLSEMLTRDGNVLDDLLEKIIEEGIKTVEERIKFLFSMGLELQEDLENGDLSKQLRQQFTNNNIPLYQNATLLFKEGQDAWEIHDEGGNTLYVIKKEDDGLNTYGKTKAGEEQTHLFLLADIVIQGTPVTNLFKYTVLEEFYERCFGNNMIYYDAREESEYDRKFKELGSHGLKETYNLLEKDIKSGRGGYWPIHYFSMRDDLVEAYLEKFEEAIEPRITDRYVIKCLLPLLGDLKHLVDRILTSIDIESLITPWNLPPILTCYYQDLVADEVSANTNHARNILSAAMFIHSANLCIMDSALVRAPARDFVQDIEQILAPEPSWKSAKDLLHKEITDRILAQAKASASELLRGRHSDQPYGLVLDRELALKRVPNWNLDIAIEVAIDLAMAQALERSQIRCRSEDLNRDLVSAQNLAQILGSAQQQDEKVAKLLDQAQGLVQGIERFPDVDWERDWPEARPMMDSDPLFHGAMIHLSTFVNTISDSKADLPPFLDYALKKQSDHQNAYVRAAELFRKIVMQKITIDEEIEFQALVLYSDEEMKEIFCLAYLMDAEATNPIFQLHSKL